MAHLQVRICDINHPLINPSTGRIEDFKSRTRTSESRKRSLETKSGTVTMRSTFLKCKYKFVLFWKKPFANFFGTQKSFLTHAARSFKRSLKMEEIVHGKHEIYDEDQYHKVESDEEDMQYERNFLKSSNSSLSHSEDVCYFFLTLWYGLILLGRVANLLV